MPQKRNSSKPPEVMTWSKAGPVLVIAGIFDAVRLMFEMFWFFGPALAALYCTVKASGAVGGLGGLTAAVCGIAAGAAGSAGAPAIETFGVVMAMATGLIGWMVIGLFLLRSNPRIFTENKAAFLVFAGGLLVSEVPIVGSVPAMTIVLWRMYRMQIHKDKKVLQAYEKERAAEQLRERQEAAQLMQMQQAQAAAADVY